MCIYYNTYTYNVATSQGFACCCVVQLNEVIIIFIANRSVCRIFYYIYQITIRNSLGAHSSISYTFYTFNYKIYKTKRPRSRICIANLGLYTAATANFSSLSMHRLYLGFSRRGSDAAAPFSLFTLYSFLSLSSGPARRKQLFLRPNSKRRDEATRCCLPY